MPQETDRKAGVDVNAAKMVALAGFNAMVDRIEEMSEGWEKEGLSEGQAADRSILTSVLATTYLMRSCYLSCVNTDPSADWARAFRAADEFVREDLKEKEAEIPGLLKTLLEMDPDAFMKLLNEQLREE